MADNIEYEPGYRKDVACTYPAAPDSGDPVRYGYRTGIALTDEDSDGKTAVNFGPFDADFSVEDSETGGISVGDLLWFHDAEQMLNNTSTGGYFFGHANEAVGDGLTATISVHHEPSPGAGTIGAGTVGTTQLADDGVTKGKIAADVAGLGLGQAVDGSLQVTVDDSTIEIATDTVQVKDSGIAAAKIAADAVTTEKILDANVTAAKLSAAGNSRAIIVPLGAVSATTSQVAFVAPTAGSLNAAKIVTKDAVVANDTDYWTFTLTDLGAAGAGTDKIVEMTTEATGGTGLEAYIALSLGTLSETHKVLAAGDVVLFTATKAASATALANAALMLEFLPAEAA